MFVILLTQLLFFPSLSSLGSLSSFAISLWSTASWHSILVTPRFQSLSQLLNSQQRWLRKGRSIWWEQQASVMSNDLFESHGAEFSVALSFLCDLSDQCFPASERALHRQKCCRGGKVNWGLSSEMMHLFMMAKKMSHPLQNLQHHPPGAPLDQCFLWFEAPTSCCREGAGELRRCNYQITCPQGSFLPDAY